MADVNRVDKAGHIPKHRRACNGSREVEDMSPVVPIHSLTECGAERQARTCEMSNNVVTALKTEVGSVCRANALSAMTLL